MSMRNIIEKILAFDDSGTIREVRAKIDGGADAREIEEKVPPLLEDGGYIPLADGRVREDVPFENYVCHRQLLEQLIGSLPN
jgi:hypothetical protein